METHDTHMENQVKRHSVTHSARVRFMGHDLNLRSEENPEVIEEVVEIVEKRLERDRKSVV